MEGVSEVSLCASVYVTDAGVSWLAGLSAPHCLVKPKGPLVGL